MSHFPAYLGCLRGRVMSSEVPFLSNYVGLLAFCFQILVFSWYTCVSDFSLTLLLSAFWVLFLVEIWCWLCRLGWVADLTIYGGLLSSNRDNWLRLVCHLTDASWMQCVCLFVTVTTTTLMFISWGWKEDREKKRIWKVKACFCWI